MSENLNSPKTTGLERIACAIRDGNLDQLLDILNWFGLTSTNHEKPCLTQSELAKTALLAAAAEDYKDKLSLTLADILLARLSHLIRPHLMFQLVLETTEITPAPITAIPVHVLSAIAKDEPSEEIDELILDLQEDVLLSLMHYCAQTNKDSTELIRQHFNSALLTAGYYSQLIPSPMFLTYMANSILWDDHT